MRLLWKHVKVKTNRLNQNTVPFVSDWLKWKYREPKWKRNVRLLWQKIKDWLLQGIAHWFSFEVGTKLDRRIYFLQSGLGWIFFKWRYICVAEIKSNPVCRPFFRNKKCIWMIDINKSTVLSMEVLQCPSTGVQFCENYFKQVKITSRPKQFCHITKSAEILIRKVEDGIRWLK